MLRASLVALLATAVSAGIYPDNHWEFSTELNNDNAKDFIKKGVDEGKTVFVRWIASEG